MTLKTWFPPKVPASKTLPKERWINPSLSYTCGGKRVIGLQIVLYNSCGDEVTYPVKGTVVERESPRKYRCAIWSLDGRANVVWDEPENNLILSANKT